MSVTYITHQLEANLIYLYIILSDRIQSVKIDCNILFWVIKYNLWRLSVAYYSELWNTICEDWMQHIILSNIIRSVKIECNILFWVIEYNLWRLSVTYTTHQLESNLIYLHVYIILSDKIKSVKIECNIYHPSTRGKFDISIYYSEW